MKRKKWVLGIALLLLSAIAISGIQRDGVKSIADVREKYPLCDNHSELTTTRTLGIEECIDVSPIYVQCTIVGEVKSYEVDLSLVYGEGEKKMADKAGKEEDVIHFTPYKIRIDKVIYNETEMDFQEEDELEWTISEEEFQYLPVLENGRMFMMAFAPARGSTHEGYYVSTKYSMYYVVDGYVYSVTSSYNNDSYSGLKVDDFISEIYKIREELREKDEK